MGKLLRVDHFGPIGAALWLCHHLRIWRFQRQMNYVRDAHGHVKRYYAMESAAIQPRVSAELVYKRLTLGGSIYY